MPAVDKCVGLTLESDIDVMSTIVSSLLLF